MTKILVAGIGNIFFGDDGFGPAVAARLADRRWGDLDVEVRDFGIRGMDLAYALTSGLDAAILVDAVARGGVPGTLYVIEPKPGDDVPATIENHAMDPVRVLKLAASLGTPPHTIRVVGCEPATMPTDDEELAMGLSDAVAAAIDPAIAIVTELVKEVTCTS